MNFLQFSVLIGSIENILQFLRQNGILSSGEICQHCRIWMHETRYRQNIADGFMWSCPRCQSRKSIRTRSFFEGQRLSFAKLLTILFLFATNVPAKTVEEMLIGDVGRCAILYWFNYYRDLMSRDLLANPYRLGGQGDIVEINESMFQSRRKYNLGRVFQQRPWVFGALDRMTKKVAVFLVPRRTKKELMDKIRNNIAPGSVIMSDEWRAYNDIPRYNGYQHRTVCHAENFVNPQDNNVHTQNNESFWGHAKKYFKNMHGVRRERLDVFLDEIVYRWNNKDVDMFHNTLGLIHRYYPPNAQQVPAHLGPPPPIVY